MTEDVGELLNRADLALERMLDAKWAVENARLQTDAVIYDDAVNALVHACDEGEGMIAKLILALRLSVEP